MRARKFGLGCLVIVAAPAFILLVVGAWRYAMQRQSFTPFRWSLAGESARSAMARDYLASRAVVGLSRERVLADLGEPSYAFNCWDYALSASWSVTAWGDPIGPTLRVWFDESGRRVSAFTTLDVPPLPVPPEFDALTWRSFAFFRAQRQPLAETLVRGDQLRGASPEEITMTLGEPDHFQARMIWAVGWSSMSDRLGLELEFGLDGRVVHAEIR